MIIVSIGDVDFEAKFEDKLAPMTCESFRRHMPFETKLIHVRWSGEGVWMPLGNMDFDVGYENPTSYPFPGQIILHPGPISETEILIAYGSVHFASKIGQLAGNHFITITGGLDRLESACKKTLWQGAQDIRFRSPAP